jgi:hypothetical protein
VFDARNSGGGFCKDDFSFQWFVPTPTAVEMVPLDKCVEEVDDMDHTKPICFVLFCVTLKV